MSRLALLGLPSYRFGTITLGSTEVPTMPASRLNNLYPWSRTRLATVDPSKLHVTARLEFPNSEMFRPPAGLLAVGGVAVVNHNLSLGAEWRIRIFGATSSVTTERVIPSSIGGSGFTGVVGDIDEDPFAVDVNYLENDGLDTDASVIVNFSTPADPPAGSQVVRFQIEYDSDVDLDDTSFALSAFQGTGGGGSDIEQLESWALPEGAQFPPSGTVFQIAFEAELLVNDAAGSDVFARIDFADSLPLVAGKVRIGAVDWQCEQLVAGLVADSGWRAAVSESPDANWGATPPGTLGLAPQQVSAWVIPTGEVQAERVRVEFRDPLNRAGYVDIGCLIVGPVFSPTRDRDWGSLVELIGRDIVIDMESGAWAGSARKPRRSMSIPFPWMEPASEWVSLFERFWRAGLLTPFVVATVDTDDVEARHLNLFARATRLPKVGKARGFSDQRNVDFEVIEVL